MGYSNYESSVLVLIKYIYLGTEPLLSNLHLLLMINSPSISSSIIALVEHQLLTSKWCRPTVQ